MKRRYLLGIIVLLIGGLAALACGDDNGGSSGEEFAFGLRAETVVADGLADDVSAIAFAPDGRIFFAEQFKGTIRIINADGTLQPEPFTQIVVADWLLQDWGLTGLALDPDFATNHFVYAFYTEFLRTVSIPRDDGEPAEHDVARPKLVRMTEVNGRSQDLTVISEDFPETSDLAPGYNANGELHFGPDGFLYASVGDYDLFDKTPDLITDLGTPVGKLLRMTKAGAAAPGNPFENDQTADARIFAYGFREPFPFTFSATGAIYGTDNTTISCEELNVIEAGGYYGWPEMGAFPFDDCLAAPGNQAIHHFSREGLEPNAFISFVEVSALSFLSNSPYDLLGDSLIVCESQKGAAADGTNTDGVLRSLTLSGEQVTGSEVITNSCFGEARVAPDGIVYYATRTEVRMLVDDPARLAPDPF
ncbi:MAG: PQQ-dependent sugar dehydrogenase [Chloroflexi bacterium]|nr:PQQ-dependent sugar dehydrogenase [Chloroflexota bacterium]